MNKLNKTAYMLLLWAAMCFSGCAGRDSTQMYLEAKVQEGEGTQDAQQTVRDDAEAETAASVQDTDAVSCFVYVCGAVNRPGVFELPCGSRVYEAIALAGGLREDAYTKGLNQAQQVQDGDMIEVLTIKEQQEQDERTKTGETAEQQEQDGLVDINTASAEQLMTLNGIGQAKAASIIAYREKNGKFSSPEEIMNVDGIGEGVYARIKDKIKVIR